ncbi:MAG: hypothetical protein R2873_28310 [Caldilineaceae bacterium]
MIEETTDYVLREMTSPNGGFYGSHRTRTAKVRRANSSCIAAGDRGYPWRVDAALFRRAYTPTRRNLRAKNILNLSKSLEESAETLGIEAGCVPARRRRCAGNSSDVREERTSPAAMKDLTEWNGLMIHALAEVGVVLGRADALTAAVNAADFVLGAMCQEDGKLYRSYKDGQACFNVTSKTTPPLHRVLSRFYEATFDLRWLHEASRLTQLMIAQFGDAETAASSRPA